LHIVCISVFITKCTCQVPKFVEQDKRLKVSPRQTSTLGVVKRNSAVADNVIHIGDHMVANEKV